MNQNVILISQDELQNIVKNAIADALTSFKPASDKPQDKAKELLTSKELAKKLRCSYQSIWNYTNAGKIPYIKANRTYLYDLDLVLESMSKNKSA